MKLKFLGLYDVTRVYDNERYAVHKVGDAKGPQSTRTVAGSMKLWINEEEDSEAGSDDEEKSKESEN